MVLKIMLLGKSEFEFGVMPARNVVVYAKWLEQGNEEVLEYRNYLASISKENHLYIHYRRFEQSTSIYNDWDIWVWPENGTDALLIL